MANDVSYRNRGSIQHYLKVIVEHGHSRLGEDILSEEEIMEEEFFLGLRKKAGISISHFGAKFGLPFEERYGQIVQELVQDGLLLNDEDTIRMTQKGIFLGYTVAEKFILDNDD